MAKSIVVRNIHPWVKDEFKRRAHEEGKAFNDYMLEVLADIAVAHDDGDLDSEIQAHLIAQRRREWEERRHVPKAPGSAPRRSRGRKTL